MDTSTDSTSGYVALSRTRLRYYCIFAAQRELLPDTTVCGVRNAYVSVGEPTNAL